MIKSSTVLDVVNKIAFVASALFGYILGQKLVRDIDKKITMYHRLNFLIYKTCDIYAKMTGKDKHT